MHHARARGVLPSDTHGRRRAGHRHVVLRVGQVGPVLHGRGRLVAISRVFVGVPLPGDITAGALIAMIAGCGVGRDAAVRDAFVRRFTPDEVVEDGR